MFSSASAGDPTGVFDSTAAVVDGCVFAGSARGSVYALDEHSGAVQWQHKIDVPSPGTGGAIAGAPEVSGGHVYVLVNETSGPYAVALDEHTVDGKGFLDAFDATNGQVLVHRQMSVDTGAPTGGPTSSGVAIADHALFVATAQAPAMGTPGYIIAYR